MFRLIKRLYKKMDVSLRLSWRHIIEALSIAIFIASVTLIVVRVVWIGRIQKTILEMQTLNLDMQRKLATEQVIQNNRLDKLEKEIFGAPALPETKTIIIDRSPQAWQRNRDKELRLRIETIERRLFGERYDH